MICSAVCLVRFMVKSPAQSGRLRTLIHPGPVSGVHVTRASGRARVASRQCSWRGRVVGMVDNKAMGVRLQGRGAGFCQNTVRV
jgi:hypothetical protein